MSRIANGSSQTHTTLLEVLEPGDTKRLFTRLTNGFSSGIHSFLMETPAAVANVPEHQWEITNAAKLLELKEPQ